MGHRSRKGLQGKKRYIFLFISTIFLTVFFFRNILIEECVSYALRRGECTCEKVIWSEGKGYIYALSMEKEDCQLSIDRVEVDLRLNGLYLEAHLNLFHPDITLSRGVILPGFLPSRFFGLKLDVEDGVLNFGEEEFHFAFQSGEEREKMGSLFLQDPELFIDLEKRGEGISVNLEIMGAECEKIARLASFIYPHELEEISGLIDVKAEGIVNFPLLLSELKFDIDFKDTHFVYSSLNFSHLNAHLVFDGIPQCDLRGELNDCAIDLRGKGDAIVGSVMGIPLEILLHERGGGFDADLKFTYQELPVTGVIYFTSKSMDGKLDCGDIIEFGCEYESFDKFEGWILAEKLKPNTYGRFLKGMELAGDIELASKFYEGGIIFSLQGKKIEFNHPLFEFSSDTLSGEIDYTNGVWSGRIPLANASLREKTLNLFFEQLYSTLSFENTSWFLENIETNYSGLKIEADAQGDLNEFRLVTTKIEGDVAPLCKLAPNFAVFPLEGKIVSRENGFCLDVQDTKVEWNFKGSVVEGSVASFLQDLSFDIGVGSKEESLTIWNVKGKFLENYTLIGHQIYKDKKGGAVDLSLLSQEKEIARCIAKLDEKGISFDNERCHLFGSEPNIISLELNKDYSECVAFEMKPHILAHGLKATCDFLSGCNLVPLINFGQVALHGDIFAHILYQKNKDFVFSAESKNLKLNQTPLSRAYIRGKKCGPEYVIEQLTLGNFGLKAVAVQQKDKWQVPDFEIRMPELVCQGEAEVDVKNQKCVCALQDLEINATSVIAAKPIQLSLTYDFDPLTINGNIKDGKYNELPLKNLLFKWQPNTFVLGCKALVNDKSLFAQLHLDFENEILGMVKLQEDPQTEGLKILFKQGNDIHSVGGNLSGLEVQLKKKGAGQLVGSISIDGEKASPLFPTAIQEQLKKYQVGAGYIFEGVFSSKGFEGILKGKEFSLLGYQLHNLNAEIEATTGRLYIGNLNIKDTVGIVEIKEIKLADWMLDIPIIQIKAKPHDKKPFIIRNFTLLNVTGNIKDLATLKGSGQLYFTNQDKKEPHFLDVPLDIIKSWGIDLGLLTPIQGEIDLQLIGEKLYLTELRNMFSEGNRSEFYLARSDSYIDIKGNLQIDLKMKQDVALKITEPFVLTIRGTLKKPKYGLGT